MTLVLFFFFCTYVQAYTYFIHTPHLRLRQVYLHFYFLYHLPTITRFKSVVSHRLYICTLIFVHCSPPVYMFNVLPLLCTPVHPVSLSLSLVPSCAIYSLLHLLYCTQKKKKKMSLCLALPNMSIPVVPFLYPPPNDFSFLVNAFMFLVYVPKHQDVSNTNTPRTLMLPV